MYFYLIIIGIVGKFKGRRILATMEFDEIFYEKKLSIHLLQNTKFIEIYSLNKLSMNTSVNIYSMLSGYLCIIPHYTQAFYKAIELSILFSLLFMFLPKTHLKIKI